MQNVTQQDGQSADIVSENIEKLKELFPDAFTEDGVNFDVLRQLLGDAEVLDEGEEKYGLNWHGKKAARQISLIPSAGTLLPSPELSLDWEKTQNLLIEGDNLEVLKILQKSYSGKVKLIYIDPPYNTGKEFVYPDRFQDNLETYLKYTGQVAGDGIKLTSNTEVGGRKHTNWLNMMLPRLRLAKTLLSQDGVIFISIDNNEVANLTQLMNEVFGEENQLGIIANVNNPKGRSDDKFIATAHEYVLVYSKLAQNAKIFGFEPEEKIVKRYSKSDEVGKKYREIDLRKTGDADRREDRPDMFYFFYCDADGKNLRVSRVQDKTDHELEIVPLREDGVEGRWRWGFNTAEQNLHQLQPRFMPKRQIWGIFEMDYLDSRPAVKSTSAWTHKDVNSERGSEQFVELGFAKEVFPRPKPIGTMRRVIELGTMPDEEAIILDFFAGSGSFAHAALQLAAENKRKLRTVSIQLPEAIDNESKESKAAFEFCKENSLPLNICSITRERLRRASTLLKSEPTTVDFDHGFKYFRLAGSNINQWKPDRTDLEETLLSHKEHLVEGRTEQDVLYELLLKRGIELTVPIEERQAAGKTIYSIGYGVLFACLDTSIAAADVDDVAQGILDWHKELDPETDTHVFFRDSAFADDIAKTNIAAILEQNGISHVRSL